MSVCGLLRFLGLLLVMKGECYASILTQHLMGQQLNKIIKRRRRKAYNERKKELAKSGIVRKSTRIKSVEASSGEKKPAAKKAAKKVAKKAAVKATVKPETPKE